MIATTRLVMGALLLGMTMTMSGCIVAEPHEGYYDHQHSRYYHEHRWSNCGERDEHCR